MKNIAIILAAGIGTRAQFSIPKQFTKVGVYTVLEHTVRIFQQHPLIDEVCIVAHTETLQIIQNLFPEERFYKVKKVITGGTERYLSTLAALDAYDYECNLIIHDSVRMLVREENITQCIKQLDSYHAVTLGASSPDTIIEICDGNSNNNDSHIICRIPNRDKLRRVQTPQCFRRSILKKAYDLALMDNSLTISDDCGVIMTYTPEIPICLINNPDTNLKLTTYEDLSIIENLSYLRNSQEMLKPLDLSGIDSHYSDMMNHVVILIDNRESMSSFSKSIKSLLKGVSGHIYITPTIQQLEYCILQHEGRHQNSQKHDYTIVKPVHISLNSAEIPLLESEKISIHEQQDWFSAAQAVQAMITTSRCLHLLFIDSGLSPKINNTSRSEDVSNLLINLYTRGMLINFVDSLAYEWHQRHNSLNYDVNSDDSHTYTVRHPARVNCIVPYKTDKVEDHFCDSIHNNYGDTLASMITNIILSEHTGQPLNI